MRRCVRFALALLLASPLALSAQTPVLGQLKFDGDIASNGSIGGAAVGPYQGDLTGYSPLFADINNTILWCVDWSHVAPSSADSYYATAFTGNDFSKTRDGAKADYQKAAWLIEQYNAGIAGYSAVNVQGSIWRLFDNTAPVNGYTNLLSNVPNAYTLSNDWFVLSDNEMSCGQHSYNCSSNQEFLTYRERPPGSLVTPEPSTVVLIGSGLVALGVVAQRRRKRHGDSSSQN